MPALAELVEASGTVAELVEASGTVAELVEAPRHMFLRSVARNTDRDASLRSA